MMGASGIRMLNLNRLLSLCRKRNLCSIKFYINLFLVSSLSSCSTQMGAVRNYETPYLGKEVSNFEIAKIDISVNAEGLGLPEGSGSAEEGFAIYEKKCSSCHGVKGIGKPADALVGGIGTLASEKPIRTVGSYWQYSTTLFDYIRRAMPLDSPKSLTNNETYALCAYILSLNGIVEKTAVLNASNLAKIQMPNRNGFIDESYK